LDYLNIDKLLFPPNFLKDNFTFFYSFNTKKDIIDNNWEKIVEDWKKERERLIFEGLKTQMVIDELVFFFVDGGTFIKIYDKRNGEDIQIYILNEVEREILLSCVEVISFNRLIEKIPHIPEYKIAAVLRTFEKKGIVYHEDDLYLCLPLRYSLGTKQITVRKCERELQISGSHRSR
jgi:hypothetical protein